MKHPYPLLFLLLLSMLFFEAASPNASVTSRLAMTVYAQAPLQVHYRGAQLPTFDWNVSRVYDSQTIYLGDENIEVFWNTEGLNESDFDLSAIWFLTTEYIVWRYGNIWRSFNGSYWSSATGQWFQSLPTAGWILWPRGELIWLKAQGVMNAHFTLQIINPPEDGLPTFTLNFLRGR